ncbi:type II toxin-antitoxin system PemK/MazF family toxin [Candidatus Sumerlaeota bacterium]|nr:type II toxin-antitoxin system PemK/MazF family toxin [Candidatus Sumerlaeota bacterium]
MVSPSAGSVVLVKFPFSDLSAAKMRPAVVLAASGQDDWILSQITGNPYADPFAVQIGDGDFASGSLRRTSFVRPGKLFTANVSVMDGEAGLLDSAVFARVLDEVVAVLRGRGPARLPEQPIVR